MNIKRCTKLLQIILLCGFTIFANSTHAMLLLGLEPEQGQGNRKIVIWQIVDDKILLSRSYTNIKGWQYAKTFDCASNGAYLAFFSSSEEPLEKNIKIFRIKNGEIETKPVDVIDNLEGNVKALKFSKYGNFLAATVQDNNYTIIKIWKRVDQEWKFFYSEKYNKVYGDFAFSDDETLFACSNNLNEITLYELTKSRPKLKIKEKINLLEPAEKLLFGPNADYLVCENIVRTKVLKVVINTEKVSNIFTTDVYFGISTLTRSFDGSYFGYLLSTYKGHNNEIFKVTNGEFKKVAMPEEFSGTRSDVLAFSPTANYIITSQDGSLKLWKNEEDEWKKVYEVSGSLLRHGTKFQIVPLEAPVMASPVERQFRKKIMEKKYTDITIKTE